MIDLGCQFGKFIVSESLGAKVFNHISNELDEGPVKIDLTGVVTITAQCANQIFGNLYEKLGAEKFYEKVIICGASDDLKCIIQEVVEYRAKQVLPDVNSN